MDQKYLDSEAIKGYQRPEALEEDMHVGELGGAIRIRGIGTYESRQVIKKQIAEYRALAEDGKLPVPVATGSYKPSVDDAIASCWAEACVVEPKLSALEWLQFCHEGPEILSRIQTRALVCTRLIPDADAGIPDGLDAAIKLFEQDAEFRLFVDMCVNKLHRLPSEVIRDNPNMTLEEITQVLALGVLDAEDAKAAASATDD